MGWKVWGDSFHADQVVLANIQNYPNNIKYQPVIFGRDIVLKAIRTWVIFYNNPPLTSISMKIYSNLTSPVNRPGKLLATSSNALTKSQIITLENGVKEIYFEFNEPVFKALETYNLTLILPGYTGDGSSHISWLKGFPDPVYKTGYTPSIENMIYAPYQSCFIGASL
jgi:hypothetical protein